MRSYVSTVSEKMLYVLLATYNESENIGAVIYHIAMTNKNVHFVLVDDSERATTVMEAKTAFEALKVPHSIFHNRVKGGLGNAYHQGNDEVQRLRAIQRTADDVVAICDCDLSHDPRDIARLAELCHDGVMVACGTRYIRGGAVAGWPMRRVVTSVIANGLARLVLGLRTTDCTGSLRVYNADAFNHLISQTKASGFAVQLELIARAELAGLQIVELPICFTERVRGTSSFGRTEALAFLQTLGRVWLQRWVPRERFASL